MEPATTDGKRVMRIILCVTVICAGLTLRHFGHVLGWPPGFVKYGGSLLWGTMVLFIVAILAARQSMLNIVLMAASIAICVELFRLVHTPWLDAFRLTLPGALLLGRVFSLWNVVAYLAGIGLGLALDHLSGVIRQRIVRA